MKRVRRWRRLENAAKIFPPTSSKKDPKVFRFACQLYDDVDPKILQSALDKTMENFSVYRYILKNGLFWYYLEESALKPVVTEESKAPCYPIYDNNHKELLFNVTYYKKRINLEIFHALSDGTGALQFLRTLVANYISVKYKSQLNGKILAIESDQPQSKSSTDSFSKYHRNVKVKRTKEPKAYRIRGETQPEYRLGVIEGALSAKALLSESKKHNATLTEYLAALLIYAAHEDMNLSDERKPVVVSVPVNLRQYFPSDTLRNFFSVVNVRHSFKTQGKTFEDVLNSVKDRFKEELKEEKLLQRMNLLTSLENKIPTKLIPLAMKIPTLMIAGDIAEKAVTFGLSNLGKIDMPAEAEKYIHRFDVFNSTKKIQVCLCSYKDTMMISITSPFTATDIQFEFFRSLTKLGLEVEIISNLNDIEGDLK